MLTKPVFRICFVALIAASIFVTFIVSGCRQAQSSEPSTSTLPQQMVSQDENITEAVKEKIAADKLVKGSKIEVRTKEGNVTLGGIVSNNTEVETAIELAWTVPGVRDVQSEMIVVREEGGS